MEGLQKKGRKQMEKEKGEAEKIELKENVEAVSEETQEEMSLEEAFEKLDGILKSMEKQDVTLDESLQYYQQGVKLLKFCNDSIDRVEKQLKVLQEKGEVDEV